MTHEEDWHELLHDPNVTAKKVRAYHKKYNSPEIQYFHDMGILGGLYKARVHLGVDVVKSLTWLHKHGFRPDIPDEFVP